MIVIVVAKVGGAESVLGLSTVCTSLFVVQEYPELVLECEASGDDVGYSVAAIFCKQFGLSDEHCSVHHKDLVVNSVDLKQVSGSRLIRLAVWQPATRLVTHHRDLSSAGMASSGPSGKGRGFAVDGHLQNHDCLLHQEKSRVQAHC